MCEVTWEERKISTGVVRTPTWARETRCKGGCGLVLESDLGQAVPSGPFCVHLCPVELHSGSEHWFWFQVDLVHPSLGQVPALCLNIFPA